MYLSVTPTTLLYEADQHQDAWGLVTSDAMVGSLTWILRQSSAVLVMPNAGAEHETLTGGEHIPSATNLKEKP